MIVIACLIGWVAGGLLAAFLKAISKAMSEHIEEYSPVGAYYFSGVFFTSALSISPSFLLTARQYGRGQPFGMSEEDILWIAFPLLTLILSAYLVLSKRLGIQKSNFLNLLALTVVISIGAILFMRFKANVYFDGWMVLTYGTLIIALFFSQIALGRVHSIFATKLQLPRYSNGTVAEVP